MTVAERRFLSFDGAPLFYRRATPDGPCAASVLVVHGMSEHSGRYLETARALAGAGLDCVIPDLRGFGQSAGRHGDARRLSDFLKDLDALYRFLARTEPGRPLFILGHSMGAFLTCSLAASSNDIRPRGLILSSPLVEPAIVVPGWKNVLAAAASVVYPIYSERIPLEARYLTHDTAILKRDASDPFLKYKITARFYTLLRRALRRFPETAARLRCPALVLQAGEDHVVSREAAERYFQNLGSTDKELVVYAGLYHEILNETTRQAVTSKIIQWILERLK